MYTITVQTKARFDMTNVTCEIESAVEGVQNGVVVAFVPHTTCALTINENADPDVAHDLKNIFDALVPQSAGYAHCEGNSQAHALASLVGASVHLIIHEGKLILGAWQGVYLVEFDGPRNRTLHIQVIEY